MERVTFSNAIGTGLVGHYHAAPARNGVVLVHGFCNDKSSNGRFDMLAAALHGAGLAVLVFDCGGCGESDDVALTPEGLDADVHAALAFMEQHGHDRLGLFGNSLGGSLCLQVRSPLIVTVAATGAATGPVDHDWSEHFSVAQRAELEATGFLTEVCESPCRNRVVISGPMLAAFGSASRAECLAGLQVPVFLIHGNHPEDAEEQRLAGMAREALPLLPHGSKLHVVDGARHGIRDQWETVIALVLRWFPDKF